MAPLGPSASRLRVLRLIARMNVGGPALQVTTMVQGLDRSRYEQRLLVGDLGPGEADYITLRAPDLPHRRIDGLGRAPRPWDDLRALRQIVREVRAFRPHIVHTHTAKAGALGRIAARSADVPGVVHTFHGHVLHGYFSRPVTAGVILVERGFARWSTRLVAVGEKVRDDLVAAGIGRREQYRVIAPGVTLPPVPERADARRRLGLPPDGLVVGFVGRLTPIKRPERVVDVALALRRRGIDVTFALLGEGELLADLERRAAPLGDRFRFLGWRSDVETFYAACDLLLLTSDNEGMPVTLIEAAHAGCPAVTTGVGSAPEVVIDGVSGLVTPPEVPALADAVATVLEDEELRRRMSRAAAEIAGARFGRERLVDDTARLYEEIADDLSLR